MIVIIDYGMGNLNSILKMIEYCNGEAIISNKIDDINNAKKLILPGVGSFDAGINNLESIDLIKIIKKRVLVDKVPILGICLGMQLLANSSQEGKKKGLGLINGDVIKFEKKENFKIPHMGWNFIKIKKKSKLFKNPITELRFYFVHSYYFRCNDEKDILCETNYSINFTSGVQKNNIYGLQFHPEKSHKFGMEVFKNFLDL